MLRIEWFGISCYIEEYSAFNPIILFHSLQNSTILIKSTQNAVTISVALLKAIHCHCQKCLRWAGSEILFFVNSDKWI